MSVVSDEKVIQLVREYEVDIFKLLKTKLEQEGYVVDENKWDKAGLLEELLCRMNSDDFISNVIEGIEDSVGIEEYQIDVANKD